MEILTIKITDEKNLEEVYRRCGEIFFKKKIIKNKNKLLEDIKYRESIGSIRIHNDFLLPHLISENINKLTVARVINYDDKILFLLLNNEEETTVAKIKHIIDNLLNKNYIDKLFTLPDEKFKEMILKNN